MSTVSLCLIVKNEEKILEQALNSIYKIADEIIIVDTGSTDNTFEIAKKFTNKVYEFEWVDDFSAARNYAQSFATMEYILRWDADWILRDSKKSLVKLQKLKESGFENADIIHFTWNLEFDELQKPNLSQTHYFLFKNNMFQWVLPIHEIIQPLPFVDKKITSVEYLDIEVGNWKDPNRKWRYEQNKTILQKYTKKEPRDLRALIMYADGLQFENQLELAVVEYYKCIKLINNSTDLAYVLEKIILALIRLKKYSEANKLYLKYCSEIQNKRSVKLIYADLLAITNPQASIELFEKIITTPITKEDKKLDYSAQRHLVHPHKMLVSLHLKNHNYNLALAHILSVIKKTNSLQTKLKFLILLMTLPLRKFSIFSNK